MLLAAIALGGWAYWRTSAQKPPEERYQRAYLLQQVKDSGGKLTKGKANRFPRIVACQVRQAARTLRLPAHGEQGRLYRRSRDLRSARP